MTFAPDFIIDIIVARKEICSEFLFGTQNRWPLRYSINKNVLYWDFVSLLRVLR